MPEVTPLGTKIFEMEPKRVALLDPDILIRDDLKDQLERQGEYRLLHFPTFESLRQAIVNDKRWSMYGHIRLLLSGLHVPGLDIQELLSVLSEVCPALPIALLTSTNSLLMRMIPGRFENFAGVVRKPQKKLLPENMIEIIEDMRLAWKRKLSKRETRKFHL